MTVQNSGRLVGGQVGGAVGGRRAKGWAGGWAGGGAWRMPVGRRGKCPKKVCTNRPATACCGGTHTQAGLVDAPGKSLSSLSCWAGRSRKGAHAGATHLRRAFLLLRRY